MTSLIACISSGKGTWNHVAEVMKGQDWEKIFIITNDFGVKNFKPEKPVEFILVDENKMTSQITEDIRKQLEGKVDDLEVGINFISGSGKEHMALIGALMKLGLGFRLIALTTKGVKEI